MLYSLLFLNGRIILYSMVDVTPYSNDLKKSLPARTKCHAELSSGETFIRLSQSEPQISTRVFNIRYYVSFFCTLHISFSVLHCHSYLTSQCNKMKQENHIYIIMTMRYYRENVKVLTLQTMENQVKKLLLNNCGAKEYSY
jgi:hypothetical protein